ncbi:unnamed protein product, partial [Adineta steineri]
MKELMPVETRLILNMLDNIFVKSILSSSEVRTITFDSLLKISKLGAIPNGFSGFNWFNIRYTNEEKACVILT